MKQSLHVLTSKLDDLLEFAGGYINTPEGVKKEKGAGAYFNRNAGKWIGGTAVFPIGVLPGWLIDRSRKQHNIERTKEEHRYPANLGKGPQLMSEKLENLIQFGSDPRPRNDLGMFTSQQEGGPDPNAMVRTYGLPPQLQQQATAEQPEQPAEEEKKKKLRGIKL